MSVEAFSWALTVPVGGNAKVVLLGLANHAHPDGSETYPALDTLATYAHCDRSTARRNLRKLADDGWIIEDGVGPKGQTKWRLDMRRGDGGGEMPPVAPGPGGGGKSGDGGVAPMPPEPSIGTVQGNQAKENACAKDPRDSLPDDFPEELKPHARHVFRVLRAVAEQHGCKAVRPLSLGRLMMGQPTKPFVETAHELHVWAADPPRPIKDVVGTYSTFLKRKHDLQAVERLDDEGLPATGPAAPPTGVTSLHGRRLSNAEQVDLQIRRLRGEAV